MPKIEKPLLRENMLKRRLELSNEEVKSVSEKILNMLINNIPLDGIKKIHIYKPIKKYNEIDTGEFINLVQQNHPDIEIEIAPKELPPSLKMPKGNKYDLVIVPVLGFDRRGFRLGYGGGYYDRFLAKNNCKQVIGLAYSFSELDTFPNEPHDQKLDKIITEKEIISVLR